MSGGKGFTSQTYTSNGSFTAPAGVTQVILIGNGGGQGGKAGGTTVSVIAPGGKSTVPQMKIIDVVPGTTYSITLGAGGTAGVAPNGAGGAGGDTLFGVLAIFNGASVDVNADANTGCVYPSVLGTAGSGWNGPTIGEAAASGSYKGGTSGGGGAISNAGGLGGAANNSGTGVAGSNASSSNFGAGGGGGGAGSSAGGNGGTGAAGFLQVVWIEA